MEHRAYFVEGDVQQLVLVCNDHVAVQQIADLAAFNRAGADLGHGSGSEAFGQEGQHILVGGSGGVFGCAARDVRQATGARHQTHTDFHQADVAFHGGHTFGGVNRQLAATAQREAANGGHHWHAGIAHFQHHALQLSLNAFNHVHASGHEGRQHALQVGAGREHLIVRPDHHALVAFFRQIDTQRQALGDIGADGVHLGFDAGNQHVAHCSVIAVQCPQANRVIFMQRGASG